MSDDRTCGSTVNFLFPQQWMTLTSLTMHKLSRHGYMGLMSVISKGMLARLVQLRLSMNTREILLIDELRPKHIPKIRYLGLQKCVTSAYDLKRLVDMMDKWEIQTLDLSHSPDIAGNLSMLVSRNFPFLKAFILSDCGLNSKDLSSLALARMEGKLEKLRHLDISYNTHLIENIFKHSCKWENLRKLNIEHGPRLNGLESLDPFVQKSCLSSMYQLRFSVHKMRDSFCLQNYGCWQQIKRLEIIPSSNEGISLVLSCITDAVEHKILFNLETVVIISNIRLEAEEMSKFLQRLRLCGVVIYFIRSDTEELNAKVSLD